MISVSGVRGLVDKDLTPELVASYGAAFGELMCRTGLNRVVLGRDSRASGEAFSAVAAAGLQSVGCEVLDCGIVPTPTVQMAVEHHGAAGGIVISASHNPIEWNAMKFVGPDGVFLDPVTGRRLAELASAGVADTERQGGGYRQDREAVVRHLDAILALDYVDTSAVQARGIRVALDCVRGAGGTALPQLLDSLGCRVSAINVEIDGLFPRNPEPVPENLDELADLVRATGAEIGLAVDPDADRLAVVDETGRPIGEDYTVALAAETVLARNPGPVAVNLSTSMVIEDVAAGFGQKVVRAPVGEANVARAMRRISAVVGGEGNGGVILPELHLGRDAPLAAALLLGLLTRTGESVSQVVDRYPRYHIVKARVDRGRDLGAWFEVLKSRFAGSVIDEQDGLRLTWDDRWLHVRPSGTEPIVRLIAEARSSGEAAELIETARLAMDTPQV